MPFRKIAKLGHPALRGKAERVSDPRAPEIAALARDMIDTMTDAGGVGLAAPQIYEPWRMLVMRRAGAKREELDETAAVDVLINPRFEPEDDIIVEGWEGCLSIPGLRGLVPRWEKVRFEAQTLEGATIGGVADGFAARILQHEIDHLNGILYPERMADLSLLVFDTEWPAFMAARAAVRQGDA